MITALIHLEEMLAILFDEHELRDLFDKLELGHHLPGAGTSYSHLTHTAVQVLYRRGRIDAPFFAAMLADCGEHAAAVRVLAAEFGLAIKSIPIRARPGNRSAPQRSSVRMLQIAIVTGSFLLPIFLGWTMRGTAGFGPGLLGAFLCGPLATLALIMKRTIAFGGSLLAGLRLLDRTSLIPVAAAATSAALGTVGAVALTDTSTEDATPRLARAERAAKSSAKKILNKAPVRSKPAPPRPAKGDPPFHSRPSSKAAPPSSEISPPSRNIAPPTTQSTADPSDTPYVHASPRQPCPEFSGITTEEVDDSAVEIKECTRIYQPTGIEYEIYVRFRSSGLYIVAGESVDDVRGRAGDDNLMRLCRLQEISGRRGETEIVRLFFKGALHDSEIRIGVYDSKSNICTRATSKIGPIDPLPPSPMNAGDSETTITVRLDDFKPSGLAWDTVSLPDPYVVVGGRTLRSDRCEERLSCSWTLPGAQEYYNVAVYDADFSDDEHAGTVTCRRGTSCDTGRGATVIVN